MIRRIQFIVERKGPYVYVRTKDQEHEYSTMRASVERLSCALSIPDHDYVLTYTLAPKTGKYEVFRGKVDVCAVFVRNLDPKVRDFTYACIIPKEWDGMRVNRTTKPYVRKEG